MVMVWAGPGAAGGGLGHQEVFWRRWHLELGLGGWVRLAKQRAL